MKDTAPEARNVLHGHLAGPVLARGDAGVRPSHVEVGAGDDAHAEVVEGAGEEAGEGGDEGHGAASAGQSDANLISENIGQLILTRSLSQPTLAMFCSAMKHSM